MERVGPTGSALFAFSGTLEESSPRADGLGCFRVADPPLDSTTRLGSTARLEIFDFFSKFSMFSLDPLDVFSNNSIFSLAFSTFYSKSS